MEVDDGGGWTDVSYHFSVVVGSPMKGMAGDRGQEGRGGGRINFADSRNGKGNPSRSIVDTITPDEKEG